MKMCKKLYLFPNMNIKKRKKEKRGEEARGGEGREEGREKMREEKRKEEEGTGADKTKFLLLPAFIQILGGSF